jgi:hypothetical protein
MRLASFALGLTIVGCATPSSAWPSERTVASREALPRAIPAPRPDADGSGDVTIAIAGADAARATLFEALEALRDEDEDALRRLVTDETIAVHAYRLQARSGGAVPRTLGSFRREVVVQRMLSARRVSRLPAETPLDGLVRPERVEVVPAGVFFARGVPEGLRAGDLVVRFEVEDLASRALLSIAVQGHGLVVVRVEPERARIVGL